MKNFCVCFFGAIIALFNFVVFVNFHLVLHVTYAFQMFFVFFLLKNFAVKILEIDGEADKIFFRH